MKLDPLLRQFHPSRKGFVLGKKFERELVGAGDTGRIAAERDPAKRTFPFAEKRPDVFRDEPRNVESVLDASFFCLRPNVVPVIKGDRTFFLEHEHRFDVRGHRTHRTFDVLLRIAGPKRERFFQRHIVRHVTVERVVRACLIGQDVRHDLAARKLRDNVRAIADKPN